MRGLVLKAKKFWMDERGITTVEVILILVVLIAIVLIFKDEITDLVDKIMDKITKRALTV